MIEIRDLVISGGIANVDIIPNKAIRIFGVRYDKPFNKMFEVGDICEEASYNLTYLGFIEGIGPKTVKIVGEHNINSQTQKNEVERICLAKLRFRS